MVTHRNSVVFLRELSSQKTFQLWNGLGIMESYTRAMVRAALTGRLEGVPTRIDPYFGLEVPCDCPDLPTEVLDPRQTWANPEEYDQQAQTLAARFVENFAQYTREVSPEFLAAGPKVKLTIS